MALGILGAKAQAIDGVTPFDNSAASKGVGNSPGTDIVNVDLYTGIGNVTIPIYDYNVEGLNLGISLSYNAKGIQVNQLASAVGLGWTVNAGGNITRTVNNIEDEVQLNKKDDALYYGGTLGTWVEAGPGYKDRAYDEYHINMAGRNIDMIWTSRSYNRFYFYPKSEIAVRYVVVSSNSEYFIDDYNSRSFALFFPASRKPTDTLRVGYYVIDEKGNQFLYLPGDTEFKDYYYPGSDSSSRWVVNKWVLSKVRTNNGNEIKFNYQKKYIAYTAGNREKRTEYFCVDGLPLPAVNPVYEDVAISWKGYVSQLSSIEYPNGTKAIIHWDSSANVRCDNPGDFVVDSISIESKFDNNLKNSITYRFNYSYFHTPTSNSNTEVAHRTPCSSIESGVYENKLGYLRLKLKSIDRIGNHSISESYYKFDYHTTPLPRIGSIKKDFYEYYNNGYSASDEGVPLHTYNSGCGTPFLVGTDRTPDTTSNLTYIQAALLQKITNGLGGTIELSYKKPELINPQCQYGTKYEPPYDCVVIDTANLDGQNATDGLIVKSILFKDGFSTNNDRLVEYSYSGGQRFFRGGYFWIPAEISNIYYTWKIRAKEYSNYMYSRPNYFNGSNHGFSLVTVTQKAPNGARLSKTDYTFSNLLLPAALTDIYTAQFADSVFYNYGGKYSTYGIRANWSNLWQTTGLTSHSAPPGAFGKLNMGLLLNKKEYNSNNNVIVEEIYRYDLNYLMGLTDSVRQSLYSGDIPWTMKIDGVSSQRADSWTTPLTNGIARLREKTVKTISEGRNLIMHYKYEYDNYDNLKSVKWTDSKGDIVEQDRKYFYDRYNNYDLLHKNMQHVLMERTLLANPLSPTVKYVLDHSVNYSLLFTQKCVFPSRLSDTIGYGTWFVSNTNYNDGDSLHFQVLRDKRELKKVRFPSIYASTQQHATLLSTAQPDEQSAEVNGWGLATLKRVKEYTRYDCKDNVLEMRPDEELRYNAYIWDSRFGHKIADITNAKFDQIAFTSFEGFTENAACSTDYGNWTINKNAVIYAPEDGVTYPRAMTGKYLYDLNINNMSTTLKSMVYELTFWADSDPKVLLNSSPLTLTMKKQGAWSLYYVKFTASEGNVLTIQDNSLSNSSFGFIDEVRLLPANASMISYTYEPLFGISSICDSRNNIIYKEYDAHGRQTITRNINRKIITKTETRNQVNNN